VGRSLGPFDGRFGKNLESDLLMPVRRERFADTELHPVTGPPRPAIARDLLRLLGVEDLSRDEQRAAVAAWLSANEPIPLLRASLRGHGLDATSAAT
jgi:hypothetical protein